MTEVSPLPGRAWAKVQRHRGAIAIVYGGQVLAAMGTLLGLRLMTEFIDPSMFGEYKLVMAGVSLLSAVLFRPLIQFTMREYHDAQRDDAVPPFLRQTRRRFYSIALLVACAAAIIAAVFPAARDMGPWVITATLLVLIASPSLELHRSLLVTRGRQFAATRISVARSWLLPGAALACVLLLGQTVGNLLAGTALALIGLLLSQEFSLSETAPRAGSHPGRYHDHGRLLAFSAPIALVSVMVWLVHESDRFFLAYFHGDAAVGIYSAAYGLIAAPFGLFVGAMAQLLYPVVFKAAADDDGARKHRVVMATAATAGTVAAAGIGVVWLLGDIIALVALGEQYRAGAQALFHWFAIGYACHAIAVSFDLAAYGSRKTTDMLVAYGIAALTNVCLNIALIPGHGVRGAAIATCASLALYLALMALRYYLRHRAATAAGMLQGRA